MTAWVHIIEPTGPYEVDHGEPGSWRFEHPLPAVSVELGRYNGKTPPSADRARDSAPAGTGIDFPGPNPLTGPGPHGLTSPGLPVQRVNRPPQVSHPRYSDQPRPG